MTNPTIGDILRVAVENKLPVSARYKGSDDQQWHGPLVLTREQAAQLCLNATAIRITFYLPEENNIQQPL